MSQQQDPILRLKKSIASTISDYRHQPDSGIDAIHVDKWISQFNQNDREFVLTQTDELLKIFYITEQKYDDFVTAIIKRPANEEYFLGYSFLDIQASGNSQHEILEKMQLAANEHGRFKLLTINSFTKKENLRNKFIYQDDLSFSAKKALSDITAFCEGNDIRNADIIIAFFIQFSSGKHYLLTELKKRLESRNINISISRMSVMGRGFLLENRLTYSKQSDVFWPRENLIEIPQWATTPTYVGEYRNGFIEGDVFKNSENRDRYEKILTEKGFLILEHSLERKPSLKPLGFKTYHGLGFGGSVFSYRNCPNNTPLVFWWGTYEHTGNKALDCWYPLMKRAGYE
ncbi:phosphoribosyltransferase-like protein [Serratia aquatilis]|uniref:PRTase-CE domain-containing protein n=1 Tax=Serratia aquatilis TaxID=1737515 RepID=A0ABV6E7M0_9GAMM